MKKFVADLLFDETKWPGGRILSFFVRLLAGTVIVGGFFMLVIAGIWITSSLAFETLWAVALGACVIILLIIGLFRILGVVAAVGLEFLEGVRAMGTVVLEALHVDRHRQG